MPRGIPKKKRAPWGSKTRNGKHLPTPLSSDVTAVTLVPTQTPIETETLRSVLEDRCFAEIQALAEQGAVVVFAKRQS